MKPIQNKLRATLIALLAVSSPVFSQLMTEATGNLLSTIQRQNLGDRTAGDQFTISFGSLNGGLASLLTKSASANGASGFATWYGNNSRTFLNWGTVVGANITDSDAYYRYYGPNTSASIYAGSALNSIYDSALDNRALAFVTYSNGGGVQEIGLYDLGFNWANPVDTAAYPLGAFDLFTLGADVVTPVYGAADANAGTYGSLSTSTVPEPSSASLVFVGAAGILALRRLKKNNV